VAAELVAGTVCVVTGAASGIGRACATALTGAGGMVALLDRNAEGARLAAQEIGGSALALGCDVSDPVSVDAAATRIEAEIGRPAVLVNAAGLLRPGALATLPLSEWNALLAVNLTGYLICAQRFGAGMLEAGQGSIVHIASIAARDPTPQAGAYSVAKAGVAMLSQQLALEWAGQGVRSNVVNPGLIHTGMTQAFYDDPEVTAARSKLVPLGRIGQPEDVARAVLWLASPAADYVTGQEVAVDGGLSRALMGLLPRPGFQGG
jgi:glucose 1-dehydrogenase